MIRVVIQTNYHRACIQQRLDFFDSYMFCFFLNSLSTTWSCKVVRACPKPAKSAEMLKIKQRNGLLQGNNSSLSSHLSCSLADRWGTTVDFTTNFLHSSRFSAFHSMVFHSRPVYCLMLFPSFPLSTSSSPSLNCSL